MPQHSVSKESFSQVAQEPFLAGKTSASLSPVALQRQQPSRFPVQGGQPVAYPQASGRLGIQPSPQRGSLPQHSKALWSDPTRASAAPSHLIPQTGAREVVATPRTAAPSTGLRQARDPYLLTGNLQAPTGVQQARDPYLLTGNVQTPTGVQQARDPYLLAGNLQAPTGIPRTPMTVQQTAPGGIAPAAATPVGLSAGQGMQGQPLSGTQPAAFSGGSQFAGSGAGATFGPGQAQGPLSASTEGRRKVRREPPVDVYDVGDELVIECELPGVDRENLVLTGHNRGIAIQGVSESELEESGLVQQERGTVEYVREIPTNVEILADEAQATFEDGILKVNVPKKEPSAGIREIEIE